MAGRHLQVLKPASINDRKILVSAPYATISPEDLPGDELPILLLGYDHDIRVSCKGKPSGNFSQGSSILSILLADVRTSINSQAVNVKTPATWQIASSSQNPFISSPARSTALKLSKNSVYTMLEETVQTTASSGITFESWIKADELSESVIAAYTSQKSPRNTQTQSEQQTFILALRARPSGYDLICNANGSLFSTESPPMLKLNEWFHFACSSRSAYALQFRGSNYVDLASGPEFNVSDFALAFTLQVDSLGSEQILFTKSSSWSSVSPLHLVLTASGALQLSYHAEEEKDSNIVQRQVTSASYLSQGVPYKVLSPEAWSASRKQMRFPDPCSL